MQNTLTPEERAKNIAIIEDLKRQVADGRITQKEADRRIRLLKD